MNQNTDQDPRSEETKHTDQSLPYEWKTAERSGETLIIRDTPEGLVELFTVKKRCRNVRTLATTDFVMYDGCIVCPYYDDDLKFVKFFHDMAGSIGEHHITEWLDEPVLILEKISSSPHL